VTPEDLLAMEDEGHYELVDGQLEERSVSFLSNRVAMRLGRRLDVYCEDHDLGWVVEAECGYRCFSWKPKLVRRADLSFIVRERLPSRDHWSDGFVTIPPDLAVEVVSPNDVVAKLEKKVEEYIRAGVRLIWVIHPETQVVQVVRGDGTGYRLRAQDDLTGEDVIPGFRCRVSDLFPEGVEAEPAPSEPAPETRPS
jgi:Uma2 family endonuclease